MLEAKNPQKTDLENLGEFGLIDHLTKDLPQSQPSTKLGIGDDAAVLDHSELQTVLTTDMLVEGVHFDLAYMPLQHLGYKAVVVNLSDVYAMNATATQITVSIAVSNRFSPMSSGRGISPSLFSANGPCPKWMAWSSTNTTRRKAGGSPYTRPVVFLPAFV